MKSLLARICLKFYYAFVGLIDGLCKDHSIQIQYGFALIACVISFLLDFTWWERCILLLCIGLVIGLEYMNTAIETLADLLCKEYHPSIKKIKDYSAASVLVASIVSLIIGLTICIYHIF